MIIVCEADLAPGDLDVVRLLVCGHVENEPNNLNDPNDPNDRNDLLMTQMT